MLSPRGCAYLVVVEENCPEDIIRIMEEQGVEAQVVITNRAKNELLSVIRMGLPQLKESR
ncbi:unnamed protein product [Discosporangium mesarthrocarpum]